MYVVKSFFALAFISLLCYGCRKEDEVTVPQDNFITFNNVVFNSRTSNHLQDHAFQIDTFNTPYTLTGFGAFTGKTRLVKFRNGGVYEGVPVIEFSGWDDAGFTYLAKDTTGRIMEMYRKKADSSQVLVAYPLTVFTARAPMPGDEWKSASGWSRSGTQYFIFKTKVLSNSATSSTGIAGCFELEYSSPDFIDTVFFKPGKGPVEILSWRAHLYENNQPGVGGYR